MSDTVNLTVQQGKTFIRVFRWETAPVVYKAISAITKSAPVSITASAHGLVSGWRAAVVSVGGMTEINALNAGKKNSDYHKVTVVDVNTITINDINSSEFTSYTSGGYLQYNTPVDLTGYSARMKIRDRVGGTELASFTSPTDILINTTTKTIQLQIEAAVTAAYTWSTGVYDLEMVDGSGRVFRLAGGKITLEKEVTT